MAVAPLPAFDEVSLEGERLYREHGRSVLAICIAVLRNREEAEDAAQQVFVSAVRALRSGTSPRDAGAWLATIARRECWLRARTRPATAELHEHADELSEDVATTVARREQISALWRAIDALPQVQREALLLREVRGLDYFEVADGLDVSHASARSLLLRARRTVRRQLERGAAVITGAPWLNVVARLFVDGQNPTLTVATRTAAIGLGALAVTGGAVIAPDLTHRSASHSAVAVGHTVTVAVRATAPTPGVQPAAQAEEASAVVHRRRPEERRRRRGHDGAESSGPASAGSAGAGGTDSADGSVGRDGGGGGRAIPTGGSGGVPDGSGSVGSQSNGSSGQGASVSPGSSGPGQGSGDGDSSPSNVATEPQSDGGGTAVSGGPGPSGAGSGPSTSLDGGGPSGDGGSDSRGGSSSNGDSPSGSSGGDDSSGSDGSGSSRDGS